MAPTLSLNNRPGKGLKLFKFLALAGFMIDIITVGAIFIVLGHDVGGPLECSTTNGLCNPTNPSSTVNSCTIPPAGNPNLCHLYTWRNFPSRLDNYAQTGLFNNDTSYQFQYNSTSVIGYGLCVNVKTASTGSAIVLPQIFTGGEWQDLGGSFLVTSLGQTQLTSPGQQCTQNTGFQAVNGSLPLGGLNLFRVAGEFGAGPGDNVQFTELVLQFFFSRTVTATTTSASLTCTTTVASTTTFIYRCAVGAGTVTASTNPTVKWEANNLGLAFQGGSATGCTIAIGANQCSQTITFAPAFAVTPTVVLSWSIIAATVNLPTPTIPTFSTVVMVLP